MCKYCKRIDSLFWIEQPRLNSNNEEIESAFDIYIRDYERKEDNKAVASLIVANKKPSAYDEPIEVEIPISYCPCCGRRF